MPNPLSKVRPSAIKTLEMGPEPVLREPELANWMLRSLTWWPFVESQLGFSLAQLLRTEAHTGAAIFGSLRSTLAQEEVLKTAVAVALEGDEDLPLFRALLFVMRKAANERNVIAHGLWGSSKDVPRALLCIDPVMHVRHRGRAVRQVRHSGTRINDLALRLIDPEPHNVWVYRRRDFEILCNTMQWLAGSIGGFWAMRDMVPDRHARQRARLEREPRTQVALRQLQKADRSARKSQPPDDPPVPTQG